MPRRRVRGLSHGQEFGRPSAERESSMNGTWRFWKALLPLLVVVFSSFFMAGCKEKSEHPKGEHPKGEHPKTEEPEKEGAKPEHPKKEHPKKSTE